jgi:hypothetical protein
MAVEAGSVVFRVGGDITALETALVRGDMSLRQFSSSAVRGLRNVTDSLAKMGAAAAVTAAGGLVAVTKSASAASKEIVNLSNVSNASAQDFQKWAFAAKGLGVEQDKLADIFKDVNDRVGDFLTTGGGPMLDFFEQIGPRVGVTAEQFRGLSGPQSLGLFVDSLNKANISQAEMTFHLEAMAGDLTLLQPLFANNSKLLKESTTEAEKFGLVLSDFDLAQLKETEKAFQLIEAQTAAAKNVIGAEFAPILNELLARFQKLKESGFDFGETVSLAVRKVAKGVAFAGDVLHGLRVVFKGAELAAVGFGAAVTTVFSVASTATAGFLDNMISSVNTVIEAMNSLPGVDLGAFPLLADSDFVQGVNQASNEMIDKVRDIRGELHNLAMQEMPSDQVRAFFDAVDERAAMTSEKMSELNSSLRPSEEKNEEDTKLLEEKLTKQQELQAWHSQRMIELKQVEFKGIQSLLNKRFKAEAAQTAGAAKHMIGTLAQTSEKAFKIQKAWAMADALVSTYQGIANGLRMSPWPVAVAATAWAAATGFAQVQSIRSQHFNGGGGGGAANIASPSAGGGGGGITQTGGGTVAGGGQTIVVEALDPNAIFSGSQIATLVEQLSDHAADGGTIRMNQ